MGLRAVAGRAPARGPRTEGKWGGVGLQGLCWPGGADLRVGHSGHRVGSGCRSGGTRLQQVCTGPYSTQDTCVWYRSARAGGMCMVGVHRCVTRACAGPCAQLSWACVTPAEGTQVGCVGGGTANETSPPRALLGPGSTTRLLPTVPAIFENRFDPVPCSKPIPRSPWPKGQALKGAPHSAPRRRPPSARSRRRPGTLAHPPAQLAPQQATERRRCDLACAKAH